MGKRKSSVESLVRGVYYEKIMRKDLQRIYDGLTPQEKDNFQDSTVLFTGGAGFLGFYFIQFLTHYKEELRIKR